MILATTGRSAPLEENLKICMNLEWDGMKRAIQDICSCIKCGMWCCLLAAACWDPTRSRLEDGFQLSGRIGQATGTVRRKITMSLHSETESLECSCPALSRARTHAQLHATAHTYIVKAKGKAMASANVNGQCAMAIAMSNSAMPNCCRNGVECADACAIANIRIPSPALAIGGIGISSAESAGQQSKWEHQGQLDRTQNNMQQIAMPA
eukprot:39531-Prymnesium_polylepis.1